MATNARTHARRTNRLTQAEIQAWAAEQVAQLEPMSEESVERFYAILERMAADRAARRAAATRDVPQGFSDVEDGAP